MIISSGKDRFRVRALKPRGMCGAREEDVRCQRRPSCEIQWNRCVRAAHCKARGQRMLLLGGVRSNRVAEVARSGKTYRSGLREIGAAADVVGVSWRWVKRAAIPNRLGSAFGSKSCPC